MKKVIIILVYIWALISCADEKVSITDEQVNPAEETAPETAPEPDNNQTSDEEAEDLGGYRSITWWDLLSEEEFSYYEELNALFEADPDYIPETDPPEPKINRDIDGQQVRIPGYIVGVDSDPEDFTMVSSFLFVPYQGACIHVPPPPENQTIYVEVDETVQTDPYMGYWLYGTIHIETGSNEIASYFYKFSGDKLEFYY